MVPFAWGGLGWDALVILIHTQGIRDNPSKSASMQKDQRLKVMHRAIFKGQRTKLKAQVCGLQKATPASLPNILMGSSRPATHAN